MRHHGYCSARSHLLWLYCALALCVSLRQSVVCAAEKADLLVLAHGTGKIERYDTATGKHLGTYLSGLPGCNAITFDPEGRLLISTGLPGEVGTVLRYDPKSRKMTTFIDIPEGYGGRLFRATGMAWHEGDLLVGSQGDGKIKRYDGKTGEWKADVVRTSGGGVTQIAVHGKRLYLTDFIAKSLRQASEKWDGSPDTIWANYQDQSPWGLVIDSQGRAYWSTSGNRILRSDGKTTVEWAGADGGLATPIGLALGADGLLYCGNLHGKVSVWKTDQAQTGAPVLTIGGDEMKQPISFAFTTTAIEKEFIYTPPKLVLGETPEKIAFFESKVRPLLIEHCISCHREQKQKGGLRLDSRSGWANGADSGPTLVAGKPDESLLIKAVRYQDKDFQMPPKKQLTPQDVETLVTWVRDGAIDSRNESATVAKPAANWEVEFRKRLDWWSLKSPAVVVAPKVSDATWYREPFDAFIFQGLEAAKLKPAPMAEPEVLLRRLSFVLTGLPPSTTLRERFLAESKKDPNRAYEKLVDELLASPHFGERFARHWMDVVRYTDTYGYEWDNPAKGSHEYRDYLIRAFNGDIKFDQFLREQLAGDLLAKPRINTELGLNESLIGPMFYHMGEHRHGSSLDFNGVHQEMVNNKIEVFSKAFLATTVACSRCHDHKLEAVSQRDYYALGAVFMTPRWRSRVVDAPAKNDVVILKLEQLREEIRREISKAWRKSADQPDAWAANKWEKVLPAKDAKVTLDQIDYPLWKLQSPSIDVAKTWNELVTEWRTVREQRQAHNKNFTPIADFANRKLPAGWVTEGDGIRTGLVTDGTPLISLEGEGVFTRLLPLGLHTHALSSKFPGALRMPPDHLVPGQHVSLHLAGGQFSGYLQFPENAFQSEVVAFLNRDDPVWSTVSDRARSNGVTRITYDFATSSLNPNFPPRTGIAPGLPNNDFGYNKRSWMSITGISTHDVGGTPLDMLDAFAGLYAGSPPKTREEAQQRLTTWMTDAVLRWCDGKSQPGDHQLLNWMLTNKLLPNSVAKDGPLAKLLAEYRQVESAIAFPRTVNSLDERDTAKASYAFNVRGNVDVVSEMVPPDFLSMFAGRHKVATSTGSGRLELADSLLQADHPLTARVYSNRVWQWVMGTGIVATPDDFGRLGERPTHPELLDFLSKEFVREGWSTKALVRRLVLSQTFRQSGQVNPESRTRDPGNRLLHHYPTRRLEAEALRDSLLAVSGRLDPQLYGRPIFPPRTSQDDQKRLYTGPLDGNGRRSLYQQMSIMDPPKFLVGFNLPDLRLPTGRRDSTNVPAQALILLNDPFVKHMASYWGKQLVTLPHAKQEERIRHMFLTAFVREPSEAELKRWTAALADLRTPGSPDLLKDETAWAQLGHAMFNAKEFLYYR